MKSRIFESATFKLTAWYLLILACISLLFSMIVYQISVKEVERRLTRYEEQTRTFWSTTPPSLPFSVTHIRLDEIKNSKDAVLIHLLRINLGILILGGIGSYFLAHRTLQPIKDAHEKQASFVSDASHEFRTPLTAIKAELEAALRDPSLAPAEMKSLLKSNLEEVNRLNKLSDVLLALSSNDAKNLAQNPFNLSESVRTLAQKYHSVNKRIWLELPKKDIAVLGHQESIEQLIRILIDNAIKYSPDQTQIKIILDKNKENTLATFKIINEGEGISKKDLPYIFDRFYRADKSRTGNKGYGLGLALAKQISNLHGTDLSCKSKLNEETQFSFSLQILRKPKA